jgi:hypothetical protein
MVPLLRDDVQTARSHGQPLIAFATRPQVLAHAWPGKRDVRIEGIVCRSHSEPEVEGVVLDCIVVVDGRHLDLGIVIVMVGQGVVVSQIEVAVHTAVQK